MHQKVVPYVSYQKKNRNSNEQIALNLGDSVIEWKKQITYAGTVIDTENNTLQRTENIANKLKQKLHSLYSVGLNPRGMNSLTSSIIWKRVILPTGLFACETWGPLTNRDINILETTQRYFSRFILRFYKRSPSDSCVSNLGLWSLMDISTK